ncbi:hypothetical protein [Candidatus Oleimmundimicrobium sp.]|nr:hypothetical protein [Candidatus Oleimmundimicrobium sp.]MDO8885523.1 hypothetical protein [Candidatus Oleimmundimicrobium sp.]
MSTPLIEEDSNICGTVPACLPAYRQAGQAGIACPLGQIAISQ